MSGNPDVAVEVVAAKFEVMVGDDGMVTGGADRRRGDVDRSGFPDQHADAAVVEPGIDDMRVVRAALDDRARVAVLGQLPFDHGAARVGVPRRRRRASCAMHCLIAARFPGRRAREFPTSGSAHDCDRRALGRCSRA